VKTKLLIVILVLLAVSVNAKAATLAPPTTTTQIQGCGQTLAALDSPIVANIVAGASSYRFRVASVSPQGDVSVQIRTSNTRSFKLTQLPSFAFNRAYTIDVAIRHGNIWYAYGPACTIYSPSPTTMLQASSCGLTMASIFDPIYAVGVPLAQGYRFRVTNLLDLNEVHIIDRTLREFRLNNFDVSSGATYLVEVAIKNYDGSYLPFGQLCSVTCPILYTKVNSSFCGHMLGAMSDNIIADLVPGVQGYRFKIIDMTSPTNVKIIDRPLRFFSMNMLSGILYNHPYNIQVAIKDPSGNYLPYGQVCTIFSPSLPIPKIQLSQCELVGPSPTELIYADEFPNATVYRFKLENTQLGYSHYVDRNSRSYNLNMFTGLLPNTAYTVRVAVKVNGSFTAFGKACDVTTSGSTTRIADNIEIKNMDTSEMPKLYPNPYSDYFSMDALSSNAEVSVRIYDMTGRLLESQTAKGNDLPSLQLGRDFPTGVYNVIVNESDAVQTYRVVKR
jgi:hypothetical protein